MFFLIVFNVMFGSLQGALQWRSSNSLCLIPLLNVSIIVDHVVEKCSLPNLHILKKIKKIKNQFIYVSQSHMESEIFDFFDFFEYMQVW